MTANAKGDVIYATDEHDRDDLPWPVEADHWFWQTGDRWVAVVADWHEDWWEGSDPADIAARPEPWRYPINETPGRSGLLVFLDAAGNERTLKLTIPGATPERKFYRTRITFEVLSDEPISPDMDVSALISECREGGYIMDRMGGVERVSVELSGAEMAQALYHAGSDPGFFQLDDAGNPIEED